MKQIFVLAIIIIIILALTSGIISANIKLGANSSERLCYEYEHRGYLPANSCYCSTQLFDSWDKSYNWIDACKVLEAKNSPKPTRR
jgi:hypothetical protein